MSAIRPPAASSLAAIYTAVLAACAGQRLSAELEGCLGEVAGGEAQVDLDVVGDSPLCGRERRVAGGRRCFDRQLHHQLRTELVDDLRAALVILDLGAQHRRELEREPGCLRELVSAPADKAARGPLQVLALPLASRLAVLSEQAASMLVADVVDPPDLVQDSQQPIADVARRRSHVLAAAKNILACGPQPRRRLRLGLLDVVDIIDGIFGELLLAFHASRRYRCAYDHATGQARS